MLILYKISYSLFCSAYKFYTSLATTTQAQNTNPYVYVYVCREYIDQERLCNLKSLTFLH